MSLAGMNSRSLDEFGGCSHQGSDSYCLVTQKGWLSFTALFQPAETEREVKSGKGLQGPLPLPPH